MFKSLCKLTLCLAILAFAGCKSDENDPLDHDSTPPGKVTNVHVENMPGAAQISYDLPRDRDMLYVDARYEIRPGVFREAQSSRYSDHILVDGFGEAKQYNISLYAIDRSGNKSDSVNVTINPDKPPVQQAYESMDLTADFGGVSLTYQDTAQADLVVTLLVKDSLNDWVPADVYYSKTAVGAFSARGFKAVQAEFGVFFKDKYDNISDTATYLLTPLFEESIDKSKFSVYPLPTDNLGGWSPSTNTLDHIFDNNYTSLYHTAPGSGFPEWTTFDMGQEVVLSRFKEYPRLGSQYVYDLGNLKTFEIWGCATKPSPDGSWDGWIKLMDCQSIKPSGLPLGQVNNDDIARATAGEDYTLPLGTPPVRYIRIKITSVWGPVDYAFIAEMDWWGKIVH